MNRTISELDLEECTGFKTYDFFTNSEVSFALTFAAIGMWIVGELTAHNWQKWKRVFLTCPCHEIYRVQAVGLKSSNYT